MVRLPCSRVKEMAPHAVSSLGFVWSHSYNLLGDRNVWSALVFAVCNAGEALVVALLIQRFFGSPFRLESLTRVFGLVAAAIVATALSGGVALIGYKIFYASPAPALTICPATLLTTTE